MSRARQSVVALLFATASASVAAQSQTTTAIPEGTREAVLAAEREKKATETSPPQRSKVERALYAYDNGAGSGLPFLFYPWHGFQLGGSNFPAGAGTKFGMGYSRDLGAAAAGADLTRANRVEVEAVGAYSTRGYSRGAAGLNIHRLGGAPLAVHLQGQHYEFPQQDFFGFGQDSREENRTDYLLRSTDAAAALLWKPARLIEIGGGAAYLKPRIGAGTDNRFPSTEELFNPATIPGFQQESDFLRSDASAALDWRDNPLHPHDGGRYAVEFSDYRDRNLDAFDFHRVSIDLQQYVPVPNRYRTIALRAAAVFTDPRAGQDVPLYFQPTLGGAQALRGFREFRFQDRNSLLFSAEYRWEAWWALDGALFVDAGTVAHERRGLSLNNLDASYGFGFRFHSNSAFVARLDFAFSREGFIPLLRFEHAF